MGPSRRWRAARQRDQVGLLGAVKLAILATGGFLPEEGRRQPRLHECLAHPVHRRGATLHRLGNLGIVPARPARTGIGLEQNAGVDNDGRRPLPGADQVIQLGAFVGS